MRTLAIVSGILCVLTIVFSVIDHRPFDSYQGFIVAAIWAFLFAAEYDPRH